MKKEDHANVGYRLHRKFIPRSHRQIPMYCEFLENILTCFCLNRFVETDKHFRKLSRTFQYILFYQYVKFIIRLIIYLNPFVIDTYKDSFNFGINFIMLFTLIFTLRPVLNTISKLNLYGCMRNEVRYCLRRI